MAKGQWEHIEKYPRWVNNEIGNIYHKYGGTSSSLVDKAFYLKGNHFEYRIAFLGQGGYIVHVDRRKRFNF